MNKAELVKSIAEQTGITAKLADEVLDAITESVTATLKAKDKVTLIGFGTFEVAERAARTGRNPKTGEEIKIKATVTPKFKPGKGLKDAVANKATKPKAVAKPAAKTAKKAK
ncbi:HU family DNA-binding protein [Aquella oligotrophica]|uniref:DNA-binding protein n=1 Tax=Aquella oligotrophica TaxID=2067065 RepID=A0A2I7N6H2_9NEIS|nr:HU family DNA-binding protein [Aquella oligotrophica]AUR51825.1 DNA-binding protein [Aquella oligotrophica]